MSKPTLLVLAAGMGSRYGGLKQMDGLGPAGEVLLEYSIYDALKAGFGKVVFIIRKDIEDAFKEAVISRLPGDLPVGFAFQEIDKLPEGFKGPAERSKPWGTAHALWCARDVVKENFAVLNADDFYGFSGFKKLVDFFKENENQLDTTGALIGFRLGKTLSDSGSVARGICRQDSDDFLSSIEEKTDIQTINGVLQCDLDAEPITLTGEELVSMNFWGFSPAIFEKIDGLFAPWLAINGTELKTEFLLPSSIGDLVGSGKMKIKVLDSEDEWIGVTYAADKVSTKARLLQLKEAGTYPEKLWN
jgi:hypothetical protein